MSRHRDSGDDPETPRPGRRRTHGPAPDGPRAGRDHGGRRDARVQGRADGSADRPRRRRGNRAQPSSIADFARPDRPDVTRGRDVPTTTGPGSAGDTTGIPAARNGHDAERTVANSTVVPSQRDRSSGSDAHRTADADGTVALPPTPPSATPSSAALPPTAPRPTVPTPRPAPARPAKDGLGPPADAAPATRAVPVQRGELGTADTASPATPRGADPGAAAPADVACEQATEGTGDSPLHTAVVSLPPRTATDRADPEPAPTPSGNRLLGVDVARGVALFGIIAVHALVEGTDDGAPATNYLVFGGRSAALFALLAGVALAFMTGRERVRWGREGFGGAAAMVAARAGVLLVIGLSVGWTDPEIAAVILPYYAIMFLLAIPLLLLPTGALAALTVVLVGAVPVFSQWIRPGLPVPTLDNPHLVDLVTDPLGLLSELTVTGAYPAMTWLAYLAAGLVVGRLRLSSLRTAWALLVGGAVTAVVAAGVSWWLLGPAGGYAHIAASTPPAQLETAPTIVDFVNAFPDGVTPTTTWWWLATIAPHSGTPLDLVQTIGSAVAVLGAALLLAGITAPAVARSLGHVLRPVAAAGSMTLTLYVVSLLFMNSPLDDFGPLEGYLWQVGAALVIGTAWRRAVGRGPLEAATSMVATAARDRVRARDRVGRRKPTGPSVTGARARR